MHDYGNNSLRRGKTDKKDAVKLANYGLDHWLTLPRYVPEEDTRLMLKTCYRQYQQYSKVQTMLKNNLISLPIWPNRCPQPQHFQEGICLTAQDTFPGDGRPPAMRSNG